VRFVIYAAGSQHASELAESARRLGFKLVAAVRNMPDIPVPSDVGPVIDVDRLPAGTLELAFAVPQTDPGQRREALADARRRGFRVAATIVDPTSVLASTATLGEAVYVGAGSVLGAAVQIGAGCLVNRSCSIAHHVVLADHVTMGPGVVVAGACRVQQGAFLGAGAVLAPEVTVGAGSVVGAGTVVVADVEPGTVVVGNPARLLRRL
jgi:sugar O-acyltransferase (sialic acid O-acetyltransferase NeuD family)